MSKDDGPPEQVASLHDAIRFMNMQQATANADLFEQCKACWASGGHLPVDKLKRFARFGKGIEWLESHPSAKVFAAMAQIENAFEILVQARAC